MKDMRFYVTIEVTAQMCGSMERLTSENKKEVHGRIIDYIHGENRKKNHVNARCYLYRENILSINDEKGQTL